jgi:hypothetical protein
MMAVRTTAPRDLRFAPVALGRLRHDRRYPPNLARHGLWPTNRYVLLAPPGPAFESFDRMTELPRGKSEAAWPSVRLDLRLDTSNVNTRGETMHKTMHLPMSAALLTLALGGTAWAQQQPPQSPNMSFFVASGFGKGGDLGGINGADARCQSLAMSVGAGNKVWRAYLSTTPTAAVPGVNARDRIGKGPWQNSKGVVIAQNVDPWPRQQARPEDSAHRTRRHDRGLRHDAQLA